MVKRNVWLVLVGVVCAALGFLAGREIWPRTPDYTGRVLRVAVPVEVEARPDPSETLPPKEAAPAPPPRPDRTMKVGNEKGKPVLTRHGPWAGHYPDGRRKSQGEYRDGKPDGAWTVWHANGRVQSQGSYERGKQVGLWRHYHADGTVSAEMNYRDGKMDGTATYWHPDGALRERGEYRDGGKHGLWSAWDREGNLVREAEWRGGVLAAPVRLFDPRGEYPPEAVALEKATVKGKYRNLLFKVAAPDDRASYKDFNDYGWYSGTSYKGHKDLPKGYWVYVYPYWYIWGESTAR
ncbi:MAG: toxin-antitoxin system YwqK family antitoxin [Planctomycetota bacterium]